MSRTAYALLWIVGLTAIVCAAWSSDAPKSSTRLFCTYNRVFIEFEQGSATWGTLMLDDEGRPVPCGDEEVKTTVKIRT